MDSLESRNRKIIDAVIRKEQSVCPGSVALIGIYGSFQTGDIHPLSDLDLLILINDDRGWQLGKSFIQEDLGVGHDIYCTNWESLRQNAEYEHPHISRLMDSQIVYCADEKYREELESLREQVRKKLAEPFREEDYQRAEKELKEARCCYADAMIAEELNDVRRSAGGAIYFAENAVALLNKTYFRKGVSRRYKELDAMERKPDNLCQMIENVLAAASVNVLKEQLTLLMKGMASCFLQAKRQLLREKKPASADSLSGTYEEMFSNWHGKMVQAAERGDRHLAFMSLESLNEMLNDISNEVDIGTYDILSVYDPGDLQKTADGFDRILQQYLNEYEKAGLRPARYADADEFAAAYMKLDSRQGIPGQKTKPQESVCKVDRATTADMNTIAELACELWPDHTVKEMAREYQDLLTEKEAAIFLYRAEGYVAGFAQCQLRHDYVEGTETSPVGYLEGIYVRKADRGKGIARSLLRACEDWAKEQGCTEFASDCELTNTESQGFHRAAGFKEANRIVAYVRKI